MREDRLRVLSGSCWIAKVAKHVDMEGVKSRMCSKPSALSERFQLLTPDSCDACPILWNSSVVGDVVILRGCPWQSKCEWIRVKEAALLSPGGVELLKRSTAGGPMTGVPRCDPG